MSAGTQWIALDAYFLGSPLAVKLRQEFGPVGLLVWVAFLCRCKTSGLDGEIRYMSEAEALSQLGLIGIDLVDSNGKEWSLETFWRRTGQLKQTARTRRGHVVNVRSTHWEHWQEDRRRQGEREKKRRWRAKNEGDIEGTDPGQAGGHVPVNVHRDTDTDTDTDISPLVPSKTVDENTAPTSDQNRGDRSSSKTNGQGSGDSVVDWIRRCVPGTGHAAAAAVVARLRNAGIGDQIIEEAAGYAAAHGGQSATYVERVAHDWMTQRDPTWSAADEDDTEPRHVADALNGILRSRDGR